MALMYLMRKYQWFIYLGRREYRIHRWQKTLLYMLLVIASSFARTILPALYMISWNTVYLVGWDASQSMELRFAHLPSNAPMADHAVT
jgi:hypothetical protein